MLFVLYFMNSIVRDCLSCFICPHHSQLIPPTAHVFVFVPSTRPWSQPASSRGLKTGKLRGIWEHKWMPVGKRSSLYVHCCKGSLYPWFMRRRTLCCSLKEMIGLMYTRKTITLTTPEVLLVCLCPGCYFYTLRRILLKLGQTESVRSLLPLGMTPSCYKRIRSPSTTRTQFGHQKRR